MSQGQLIFDGATYDAAKDCRRLSTQLDRVRELLNTGRAFSIRELARLAGGSEAGISARIRDLRKPRFGGYQIERRRVSGGLWEYRMAPEE